jgi:hypothetical protein
MSGVPARGAVVELLCVTANGVRCGDLISIGGTTRRVESLRHVPPGKKKLMLDTGESVVLHSGTAIDVTRYLTPDVSGREARGRGAGPG